MPSQPRSGNQYSSSFTTSYRFIVRDDHVLRAQSAVKSKLGTLQESERELGRIVLSSTTPDRKHMGEIGAAMQRSLPRLTPSSKS